MGIPSGWKPNLNNPNKCDTMVHNSGTEETSSTDNVNLTIDQYIQLLTLLSHQKEKETKRETNNSSCVAFLAGTTCLFSLIKTSWVIDNGESDHMCHDLSFFDKSSLVHSNIHDKITIPDGREVPVTHI